MPLREQRRVRSIALAAARQHAVDLAFAPEDLAELPLERLETRASRECMMHGRACAWYVHGMCMVFSEGLEEKPLGSELDRRILANFQGTKMVAEDASFCCGSTRQLMRDEQRPLKAGALPERQPLKEQFREEKPPALASAILELSKNTNHKHRSTSIKFATCEEMMALMMPSFVVLCFLTFVISVTSGAVIDTERNIWTLNHLEHLKADVLRFLPKDAVDDRFRALPLTSPPPRQDKIDHVVVLYMENHAADAFFGCMDLPGFDGIKGHSIPKDPTNLSKGKINITCGNGSYVCEKGPSYDTFAPKFGKDGNPNFYPYSPQSDNFSAFHGASENGTAVNMFGPEQIPIKASLAHHFGVFNKLFTATPTASTSQSPVYTVGN
eukprot:Skav213636  [mRNA]  locus=scaffold2012:98974:110623:+ [translate_table: standard]